MPCEFQLCLQICPGICKWPPLQQLDSMGRMVQVLITHTWNDAFTTVVDEYVKNLFYWVSKMILYDARCIWHLASKEIVTGTFLFLKLLNTFI